MKIYSKSNRRWCSIKTKYFTKFIGNVFAKAFFLIKLPQACNFFKKETLAQVFLCKFWEIFKNTFLNEHIWVTANDIRMQVVVIYNLSLSLHFVTINFAFFSSVSFHTAACFKVAWIAASIYFSVGSFLATPSRPLLKKNNIKA